MSPWAPSWIAWALEDKEGSVTGLGPAISSQGWPCPLRTSRVGVHRMQSSVLPHRLGSGTRALVTSLNRGSALGCSTLGGVHGTPREFKLKACYGQSLPPATPPATQLPETLKISSYELPPSFQLPENRCPS